MNWKFHDSILIQGIVAREIVEAAKLMATCGVKVVAGVSGGSEIGKIAAIPVFDLVAAAIQEIGAIKTSIILASGDRVLDVALEAIASEIEQLVIITPNITPLDTIELFKRAKANNTLVLGPGSAGMIVPEQHAYGILQPQYFVRGNVGIIGYTKALIYEIASTLNSSQMGQSIAIALGENKIANFNIIPWLEMLDRDDSTKVIVLIQIVQDINYKALEFIAEFVSKPVICYLVGSQTPADKVFRNSRDILYNHLSDSIPATNSYSQIVAIIEKTGAFIAHQPSDIPQSIKQILQPRK